MTRKILLLSKNYLCNLCKNHTRHLLKLSLKKNQYYTRSAFPSEANRILILLLETDNNVVVVCIIRERI